MDGLIKRSPADDAVYTFMDRKRAQGNPYYLYMTARTNKFLRIYYGRVKQYMASLEMEQQNSPSVDSQAFTHDQPATIMAQYQ